MKVLDAQFFYTFCINLLNFIVKMEVNERIPKLAIDYLTMVYYQNPFQIHH